MRDRLRNLVLWIAVIGSFTISIIDPSVRLPAMFFVFLGITVMLLRWRRRNPNAGEKRQDQPGGGGTA